MRLNKYIAASTSLSRRAADEMIAQGRVRHNGQLATPGDQVQPGDNVTLDDRPITPPVNTTTIMLNKPRGYVVSRNGQGSPTIYELLSPEQQQLQPVGRLDKDSSGLLLLTNDGQLAQELTHPSHHKIKIYQIELDRELSETDMTTLITSGVQLQDGLSMFDNLRMTYQQNRRKWTVTMHQGRNRQIRRTFAALGLGYNVRKLHRVQFGDYRLNMLASGETQNVTN